MMRIAALSAVALAVAACEIISGPSPAERAVDAFVESQPLPDAQEPVEILAVEEHDVVFFRVSYGEAHDCPSGCFYSSAFGLKYGARIGWIDIEHYEYDSPLDSARVTFYDVAGDEGHLFTEALAERLEAADGWVYRVAFRSMLAGDEDTPRTVLLRLAGEMYDYIQPSLGWILLENPVVRNDREILELLADLPTFQGDAYADVRAEARKLLDELEG